MLEFVDIMKLSSAESIEKIFQALGRLLLEPVAEKFLLDFKTSSMIMIFYLLITCVDDVRHGAQFGSEKKKTFFLCYMRFCMSWNLYSYVLYVLTDKLRLQVFFGNCKCTELRIFLTFYRCVSKVVL